MNIVESFPEKMQQIFKLKFISNYKYAEIADELGISINTVKIQLKRAKIKIHKFMPVFIIMLSTY